MPTSMAFQPVWSMTDQYPFRREIVPILTLILKVGRLSTLLLPMAQK